MSHFVSSPLFILAVESCFTPLQITFWETIVGKWADSLLFLFFYSAKITEPCAVKRGINSVPNNKVLDWIKLKAFADNKINFVWIVIFVFNGARNHCGKRRKCWLPAFSPFPTRISKDFHFRVNKNGDCVVNSYFVTVMPCTDQVIK